MASVYILFSQNINKFYIGSCLDVEQRLLEHNDKIYFNSYTKITNDWKLYFEIPDLDYAVARTIEKHIKLMKSRKYIENLKKYPEITEKLIIRFLKNSQ